MVNFKLGKAMMENYNEGYKDVAPVSFFLLGLAVSCLYCCRIWSFRF